MDIEEVEELEVGPLKEGPQSVVEVGPQLVLEVGPQEVFLEVALDMEVP